MEKGTEWCFITGKYGFSITGNNNTVISITGNTNASVQQLPYSVYI